jgi:hypothetical protein
LLDNVAVYDANRSHACACKLVCNAASKRTATHNQHSGIFELLLTLRAKVGQQHLSVIPTSG